MSMPNTSSIQEVIFRKSFIVRFKFTGSGFGAGKSLIIVDQ